MICHPKHWKMELEGKIFNQELNSKMQFQVTAAIGTGRQWCVVDLANNLFYSYDSFMHVKKKMPPLSQHKHTHTHARTRGCVHTECSIPVN